MRPTGVLLFHDGLRRFRPTSVHRSGDECEAGLGSTPVPTPFLYWPRPCSKGRGHRRECDSRVGSLVWGVRPYLIQLAQAGTIGTPAPPCRFNRQVWPTCRFSRYLPTGEPPAPRAHNTRPPSGQTLLRGMRGAHKTFYASSHTVTPKRQRCSLQRTCHESHL